MKKNSVAHFEIYAADARAKGGQSCLTVARPEGCSSETEPLTGLVRRILAGAQWLVDDACNLAVVKLVNADQAAAAKPVGTEKPQNTHRLSPGAGDGL